MARRIGDQPGLNDIQLLLDASASGALIVSCYADVSLTGFAPHWAQHLKTEIGQMERALQSDREARRQFDENIAVVQRALAAPAVRRARGMAVFSSVRRGLFQTFVLNVPVRNVLVIDERPYLVPLPEAMHRQRRNVVVLTDSHRGRLYAAGWGRAELLHELAHEVPRRQRSAGETWGKQQATIARHREDHLLRYRKSLVNDVRKAWDDTPYRGLILLGEQDTLAALRAELPAPLAALVVHAAPYSWTGRHPAITDTVQRVLEDALRAHDQYLIQEIQQHLTSKSGLVAAGPQEVIDALHNGQVGYPGYLVLERDRGHTAAKCVDCGAVSAEPRAACPFCKGRCEKVSLWQEVLLFAARHDIPAHVVDDNATLAGFGGIAAMLSRRGPWEPVAPSRRVERRRGTPVS